MVHHTNPRVLFHQSVCYFPGLVLTPVVGNNDLIILCHLSAVLISVNRSATETSLYEAIRYAWKISRSKAELAEVILGTSQGLIVGAFVADAWLEATAANFPGRDDVPGRMGFVGREAPDAMSRLYVGKRVPDEYRKRGAANPIKLQAMQASSRSRGGARENHPCRLPA